MPFVPALCTECGALIEADPDIDHVCCGLCLKLDYENAFIANYASQVSQLHNIALPEVVFGAHGHYRFWYAIAAYEDKLLLYSKIAMRLSHGEHAEYGYSEITWGKSAARAWLNSDRERKWRDFGYLQNFSESERQHICNTRIDDDFDRVFLFSPAEYLAFVPNISDQPHRLRGTVDCERDGSRVWMNEDDIERYEVDVGVGNESRRHVSDDLRTSIFVRPALWVSAGTEHAEMPMSSDLPNDPLFLTDEASIIQAIGKWKEAAVDLYQI